MSDVNQHIEDSTPPTQPEMSFEEAFRRLEETAQVLEAGNLTLDEATRLYEEGMNLAKLCNHLLTATQLKITELRNAYSNDETDAPPENEEYLASG